MTEQQNTTQTPEDRAEAAARELADTGRAVTARAVREAAGVRMTVASAVAKAWNEAAATDEAVEVPSTPEDVTARAAAIWAEAYRAAVAMVSPQRDALADQVSTLTGEVEALTATVEEVEAERDQLDERVAESLVRLAEVNKTEAEAVARAERAEERTSAAEAERDRALEQVAALIAKIPN